MSWSQREHLVVFSPLHSLLPLRLMQGSTVCADCYLGFGDSCLEVGAPLCWAEDGHLPGELWKTPNPDGQWYRKGGTILMLQKGDWLYPKSPKGTEWPAQLQAQLFVLHLKLCFADTGFLPLRQGIRGAFLSFTLFCTHSLSCFDSLTC